MMWRIKAEQCAEMDDNDDESDSDSDSGLQWLHASKQCKHCYDCTSQTNCAMAFLLTSITSSSTLRVHLGTHVVKYRSHKVIPILNFMSLTPGESVVCACVRACVYFRILSIRLETQ